MLRQLWLWWKVVARRIGEVQSRVILTLFYFVVAAPFAVGLRLFGDPLRLAERGGSNWIARPVRTRTVDQARGQF